MVRVEPRIDLLEVPQTPDEQRGTNDEHQRQGNLNR